MKTAVSIPDPLFASAETLAERLGLSRSALYAQALYAFLADQRLGAITRRLNAVYARDAAVSALDPALQRLQRQALSPEDRSEEW